MIRTQVYLTKQERSGLEKVSRATGKKQSELIRKAVDDFLHLAQGKQRELILNEAAGLWRHRDDLPYFSESRASWDRRE